MRLLDWKKSFLGMVGLLLLLGGKEAHAGYYECVGTTGSGTVTVNSTDWNYTSGTYNIPFFYLHQSVMRGSVSFSATETRKFVWVRDIDPATQAPDPNDNPVSEAWEFGFYQMVGFSHPNWASESGSGNGSINVENITYSASATGSYTGGNWSFSKTSSGESGVTIGYVLEGEEPEVSFTASGSVSASGDVEASLTLLSWWPSKPDEEINHTAPLPNNSSVYSENSTLTPTGTWRGAKGQTYKLSFFYDKPFDGLDFIPNGSFVATANGLTTAWSDIPIYLSPDHTWRHQAILYLRQKNGITFARKKHSIVQFTVSAAINR